jgi:hypothetical protein
MKTVVSLSVVLIMTFSMVSCIKHTIPIPPPYSKTLVLRPDSTTGQDSHVAKLDHNANDGNTNLNFTHELVIARWSLSWANYDTATYRSYIRFDSLARIPATATVSSAPLYLYGESTSASFPFGNSYYPGSGNPPNNGWLRRVTGGTWDQKTITWNNAPAMTTDGQIAIPASTSEWGYAVQLDVTNMVKQMVASPSTNYGFGLALDVENIYRSMEFSTCEVADSTLRPKLVVNYHN